MLTLIPILSLLCVCEKLGRIPVLCLNNWFLHSRRTVSNWEHLRRITSGSRKTQTFCHHWVQTLSQVPHFDPSHTAGRPQRVPRTCCKNLQNHPGHAHAQNRHPLRHLRLLGSSWRSACCDLVQKMCAKDAVNAWNTCGEFACAMCTNLLLLQKYTQLYLWSCSLYRCIKQNLSIRFGGFIMYMGPRPTSWAFITKVMFLLVSVILLTGRGSASVHDGIPPPRSRHRPGADTSPQEQTPPPESRPPPGADTPSGADTPLGSRLRHTVNEQLVCILLECILGFYIFSGKLRKYPRSSMHYWHYYQLSNNRYEWGVNVKILNGPDFNWFMMMTGPTLAWIQKGSPIFYTWGLDLSIIATTLTPVFRFLMWWSVCSIMKNDLCLRRSHLWYWR